MNEPTPEEAREAERQAQAEALFEAVRRMREREAAQKRWLMEQIQRGLAERDEEVERRREDQ